MTGNFKILAKAPSLSFLKKNTPKNKNFEYFTSDLTPKLNWPN